MSHNAQISDHRFRNSDSLDHELADVSTRRNSLQARRLSFLGSDALPILGADSSDADLRKQILESLKCDYPMWALPVAEVMKLESVLDHQLSVNFSTGQL